jgi:hypothetical protein
VRKMTKENAEMFKKDLPGTSVRIADESDGLCAIASNICKEEKGALAAISIELLASFRQTRWRKDASKYFHPFSIKRLHSGRIEMQQVWEM